MILSELLQANVTIPEVDTLAAITMSANAINGENEESEKHMIIYDSGLSTTGLLPFSEKNLLDEPVESIIEQLTVLHAIPDLTDIEITWVGLGTTCGDQTPLTTNSKYKLQVIWKEILKAGDAKSVVFDTTLISQKENDVSLPECNVVPVIAESIELTPGDIPEIVKWDENSSVKFESNSAVFIDEVAARKEMEPIADYLTANPEENIHILGMTATVAGGDNGIELSKQRGEACKEILMQLGIDENRIKVVGLGQIENSLRVEDIDSNGNQIKDMAAKNRAVFS